MGEPSERKKPNTVRTDDREKLVNAMRDEALIKQLKDAMYSERIREKPLMCLLSEPLAESSASTCCSEYTFPSARAQITGSDSSALKWTALHGGGRELGFQSGSFLRSHLRCSQ
jgi:hypothetical protein